VRVALGALPRQIVLSVLGSASTYLILGTLAGSGLGVLLDARPCGARLPNATTGGWVIPAVILPLLAAGLLAG
jgi:hypothetical protein